VDIDELVEWHFSGIRHDGFDGHFAIKLLEKLEQKRFSG
jgi:hypothetical protein